MNELVREWIDRAEGDYHSALYQGSGAASRSDHEETQTHFKKNIEYRKIIRR
ncbi:hypothetical protein U27_01918 [Candidatus Vecturithrix granuli]|uniref:Uncharacterized protein n=1 Tax=Vecturithrix granuli TaxID=1499967 RepID=A0A0S6W9H1_VECG1|nr:hypothetical protein U27_01918 [Candidatus Vecturithrix granuli]